MRTFEFKDAKSSKFWNIDLRGNAFTVTYGKIGSSGRSSTKTFPTAERAQAAADKLVAEKLGKGYVETTPGTPSAQAAVFERAILENPADGTIWRAYADYLAEEGDPRGEFMQVQLALEEESRPAVERKKLQAREKALLKEHEKEWLGELAPHLLDNGGHRDQEDYGDPDRRPWTEHRWGGGFLASLRVQCLTRTFAQTLAAAPAARFLRELRLHGTSYYWSLEDDDTPPRVPTPAGAREHYEWFELIGAPCLRTLRLFYVGDEEAEPAEDGWCDCHTSTPGIHHVIAGMPRVEELHLLCKDYETADLFALPNLTHLRVLRVYHLGGYPYDRRYEYALDVLAANPALGNLTHLLFHPHQPEGLGADGQYHSYLPLVQVRHLLRSPHLKSLIHLQLRLSDMGDAGVREIIASGILKRLKWLDLRHGCITDEGARAFAACSDARNLERLDLSRNAVTAAGLRTLRAAKVNAVANRPLTDQELEQREYLREGDFE
jgi:uncharacterized protein (TIGR02996 family)